MRKSLPLVSGILAILIVAAAFAPTSGPLSSGPLQAAPAGSRWNAKHFTNTELVTQDGKTVRFYDDLLENKIFVINFIFTGCSQLCPLTTARLAVVQEQLGEAAGRDVFFYSISLDPMTDTPAALKKFADNYKVGPGWLFLTGDPDNVKVVRDRLGERSRDKSEHQANVIVANDQTGEWRKDSAMSDTDHLVRTIRSLKPEWRDAPRVADAPASAKGTDGGLVTVKNIPGYALFNRACASCHTIGQGDRIGPDLAGVSARRPREWLKTFISRPDQMRASGDPVALELYEKYNRVMMPFLGLSEIDAEDALLYIDAETSKAKTASATSPDAK